MKNIDNLSSLEGRALLSKIFKELKYDKQLRSSTILFTLWKICTYEKELFRYSKQDYTIVHPLGMFSGTSLWLEEIVNRYYFSTINSFVYFGAAILLVLIGVRRFSDNVSDTVVIGGIVFESLMLLIMFLVMLFSPNEQNDYDEEPSNGNQETVEELILEVGEISRDFAAVSVQLDNISESLNGMLDRQTELIELISQIAKSNAEAVSPNPKMLDIMDQTNASLSSLKDTVIDLNKGIKVIQKEEIEFAVKKEIEQLINTKLSAK